MLNIRHILCQTYYSVNRAEMICMDKKMSVCYDILTFLYDRKNSIRIRLLPYLVSAVFSFGVSTGALVGIIGSAVGSGVA